MISALATWAFLVLMGVPYGLALGLWVGIVSQFIPTVGTYIAMVLPVIVALAQDPVTALWVLLFLVLYQQFENYVLGPRITKRTMEVHPAVAIGTVFAGGLLLGGVGAVLALPTAAVVQALISTHTTEQEVIEARSARGAGASARSLGTRVQAIAEGVTSSQFSLASARRAAADDRIAEWVGALLASPGSDNAVLAAALATREHWWWGPVLVPADDLVRLAGPEDDVLVPVDTDEWEDDVSSMTESLEDGWEPPPLLVEYQRGRLLLQDGNHRYEALVRDGAREVWVLVYTDDPAARDEVGRAIG